MRGAGGPLLCIGDLLSDLGESNSSSDDASPSNPQHNSSSSSSISSSIEINQNLDLTNLFQENYKQLDEALAGTDHSWTALTLKLCNSLETANKLVHSTNSNVKSLLEKVDELEKVVKRGDSAVTAARAVNGCFSQKEQTLSSQSLK